MVEGDNTSFPFGPLESLPSLQSLLPSHLILIELGKIVNNDRNGQRNYQNPTNTTHASYNFPQRRRRVNVAVTNGGHGDAGPPEGLGYTDEFGTGFLFFGEVSQTRENKNTHGQKQHQQAQLLVGVPESETQGLQTGGMTRQLEDPEDSHDTKHLDHAADVLELIGRVLVGLQEEERDEIRQYG